VGTKGECCSSSPAKTAAAESRNDDGRLKLLVKKPRGAKTGRKTEKNNCCFKYYYLCGGRINNHKMCGELTNQTNN
jgi:hypothetical protein